jgi:HD-like signal output (HDOD) protein/DNA-binding response OmpR family regulator
VVEPADTGSETKLLVVHGDTEARRSFTSGFQSAGFKVHAVVRAANAEKFIRTGGIGAVLLAVEEDMASFSTLREILEQVPGAPVIALLRAPGIEDVRAAFRLGAADVMSDESRVPEVVASVVTALGRKSETARMVTDIPVQEVAVIHGDESLRERYVGDITRLGHSATGVESTEHLRGGRGKKQPTMLLCSVKCWRESGPAFVRGLSEKSVHPRVIVVGTHRTLRSEDELRDSGVQLLLVDPVPALELERHFKFLLTEPPASEGLGSDDIDTQRKRREESSSGSSPGVAAASAGKGGSSSEGKAVSPMREEVLELAEKLRSGNARVSNISPIAMELQALCAEGPASMSELVEKIEQDPNLAAATLRASNSVAYRGMPRVIDIRAAGQRLGTRRLGEVAQTEAIKGVYGGRKQGWGRLLMKMWRHTVITAHAARLLGERLELTNQQAIYSMALLHNIGEVLIVDLYRKAEYEAPKDGIATGALLRDMNRRHSALGALLLKSWDFPPALSSIALAHHDPSTLPDGTPLSRHAWLIGALASVAMAGPTQYKEMPAGGPPLGMAATVLGIRSDEFEPIVDAAQKWWAAQGD